MADCDPLEASWSPSETSWGTTKTSRGISRVILLTLGANAGNLKLTGALCRLFGPLWGLFGHIGSYLGTLGAIWGTLGLIWCTLGSISLVHIGNCLMKLQDYLVFGTILCPLRAILYFIRAIC